MKHSTPSEPEGRGGRRVRVNVDLPKTFTPKFWADADQRTNGFRAIDRRVRRLKRHCGADSVQKDLLCERAAFLSILLETAERNALENTGLFDGGAYTQALNTLLGLLKTLGLQKHVATTKGLRAYVEEKSA